MTAKKSTPARPAAPHPKKKGAAQRKRSGRKKAQKNNLLWMVGGSVGLVILLLGFTVGFLLHDRSPKPPAASVNVSSPNATKPASVRPAAEQLLLEVEGYLFRNQLYGMREEGGGTPRIRLTATAPLSVIEGEIDRLARSIDQGFSLTSFEDGSGFEVRGGNRTLLTLMMPEPRPETAPAASYVGSGLPQVAIIIDDIGRDLGALRGLLDTALPITYSILPNEMHATRAARLVHESGQEVFLHIPMEPKGYPEKNPGPGALLVGADGVGIIETMDSYLAKVPFAVGGNNHMGSRFTEDREGMSVVLGFMRDRGLLFVDSLTSSHTVAPLIAGEFGMPFLQRDIFLDNVQEVDAICRQVEKLISVARRKGRGIGIGHPYPETVEALRRMAQGPLKGEVEVVAASVLFGEVFRPPVAGGQ